jgi:imidazolonepropionase-like amidohydrolase
MNLISLNPARYLGFDHETGSIEIGKRADLRWSSRAQDLAR